MDGFSFKIDYSAKRNRFIVLFTPFILVPYIILAIAFVTSRASINYLEYFSHGSTSTFVKDVQKSYHHIVPNPIKHMRKLPHIDPISMHHMFNIPPSIAFKQYASINPQLIHALTPKIKPEDYNLGSYLHLKIEETRQQRHQQLHSSSKFVEWYRTLPFYGKSLVIAFGFAVFMIVVGFGFANHFLFALPLVLTIFFKKKYPTWWFSWIQCAMRFGIRVAAFALFLTPNIPSLEESEGITLHLPNPSDRDLKRGMPLIKWLLALPHTLILLCLLTCIFIISALMYPYLIVFGHYPKPIFNFIEGVLRWDSRVKCYSILLCTDEYPTFSLK